MRMSWRQCSVGVGTHRQEVLERRLNIRGARAGGYCGGGLLQEGQRHIRAYRKALYLGYKINHLIDAGTEEKRREEASKNGSGASPCRKPADTPPYTIACMYAEMELREMLIKCSSHTHARRSGTAGINQPVVGTF